MVRVETSSSAAIARAVTDRVPRRRIWMIWNSRSVRRTVQHLLTGCCQETAAISFGTDWHGRTVMIVLHQFESCFGVPNASGFCLKLECFLRIAGLPYRTQPLHDLGTAPKGKGPFITDEDGSRI